MKILLIHGLSRTPLSLLGLEWYLQQKGITTEQFSYLAVTESFDRIVERLSVRFQALSSQGSYGIVAHSLGGLLTRAALGLGSIKLPQHIVMLGTPNQLPRLAPQAWQLPPFRWWTGQCGFNLFNPLIQLSQELEDLEDSGVLLEMNSMMVLSPSMKLNCPLMIL